MVVVVVTPTRWEMIKEMALRIHIYLSISKIILDFTTPDNGLTDKKYLCPWGCNFYYEVCFRFYLFALKHVFVYRRYILKAITYNV